jgi:hypothetical protein
MLLITTTGLLDTVENEVCERCGNKLFGPNGPLLWCVECRCPIIFSADSLRILPLIPIVITKYTPDEAKEFVNAGPPIDPVPIEISDLVDPTKSVENSEQPVLNADTLTLIDPSHAVVLE